MRVPVVGLDTLSVDGFAERVDGRREELPPTATPGRLRRMPGFDLETEMKLGRELFAHSFALHDAYDPAFFALGEWAMNNPGTRAAEWVVRSLQRSGHLMHGMWLARWAGCGFPRIVLGHKLAAALMATRAPGDVLGELLPPWPAYLVDVPHGLMSVPFAEAPGGQTSIDVLLVHHEDGGIRITLESRQTNIMVTDRQSDWAAALAGDEPEENPTTQKHLLPTEDAHRRALHCGWRLAIGVEIELTDPAHVRSPRPRRPARNNARPATIADSTYTLVREVNVDCREEIGAFLSGRASRAPSVRTLVRGHWKRQAVGPGGTDRKWIHVEPYWRGPQDGPIAIGVHRLRDK